MTETKKDHLEDEWWTPEVDASSVSTQSFKIRALDGIEFLEIMSLGSMTNDKHFQTNHDGKLYLIRRGLIDWKGVEDKGDPVPCSADAAFRHLSATTLFDLAQAVFGKAALADEQKRERTRGPKFETHLKPGGPAGPVIDPDKLRGGAVVSE